MERALWTGPSDCARVEIPQVSRISSLRLQHIVKRASCSRVAACLLEIPHASRITIGCATDMVAGKLAPSQSSVEEEYALQTINWLETRQIRSCGERENKLVRRDGRRPNAARKTELQTLRSRRIQCVGYRTDTCFEIPLFSCEISGNFDLESSTRKGWLGFSAAEDDHLISTVYEYAPLTATPTPSHASPKSSTSSA